MARGRRTARVSRKSVKRSTKRRPTKRRPTKRRHSTKKRSTINSVTLTLPSKSSSYKSAKSHKSKKSKKSKGPSPYNKFVKKMSPILRSKNPDLKQPQIMKLIAKEWNKQKTNNTI